MRVFVAGSTGAVGRLLVPLLVEKKLEVVALIRDPQKAKDVEALGAKPLARAVGAKPPYRVPLWLGRLVMAKAARR